jgi:predicted RNA polymerase sigma factor
MRAQMLRRLDRSVEAMDEDRIAAELTSNPAELSLLHRRIEDATFITVGRLRKL